MTSRWLKRERRGKGDIGPIPHPGTRVLRDVDAEALGQRALLAAPQLAAVRLNLSLRPLGLPNRRYYWVTDVGEDNARSLRAVSVADYNKSASIDKEAIAFLKQNRYGEASYSYGYGSVVNLIHILGHI